MDQMEFDNILGDKPEKETGKKTMKKAMTKTKKTAVKKPVFEAKTGAVDKDPVKEKVASTVFTQQPSIGRIVHFAVNIDNELTVHPAIIIKVNPTGSLNVNVFHPGYMALMEKVPFTGLTKTLGACHWPDKL